MATNSGGLANCEHNNQRGHLEATNSGGQAHCEHNTRERTVAGLHTVSTSISWGT
jgi:hypothetical protein